MSNAQAIEGTLTFLPDEVGTIVGGVVLVYRNGLHHPYWCFQK